MYHARFKGTHYEIGRKWGELLRKNNKYLLDNIPFEITKEMEAFSKECLPYYKDFFPGVIEEINGIAKGQLIDPNLLYAILFSMYGLVRATNCSSFIVKNERTYLLGRNSDFLTAIEKMYMNCLYTFKGPDSYSFSGNTTAFVEMEDGINQCGLAIALTSVFPDSIKPGMNVGMILRMILEKCQNVEQALELLKRIPRCTAGTLVMADLSGEACLVEFTNDRLVHCSLNEKGFLCATNSFHLPEMQAFKISLDDDWFAEKRYRTLEQYLAEHGQTMSIPEAKKLLGGDFGFLCQYDRKTGKDTVWSSIYDLKNNQVFRCEGNPSRKQFKEDSRFIF
ncbi:C45 family autoproteolytic acyltransferase/hydolase [Enterococcus sp. AZ007]|uniref:C45 family autoproteolytic acyltransferase/hydolase n=1 Tax=Enterococcus sp. AZ007 TaxID=2774839 RepID=UPI003F27676F